MGIWNALHHKKVRILIQNLLPDQWTIFIRKIYKRLIENTGLKKIIIYTTRPLRNGEKDGADYHFVDEKEYE